jgi:hypothetical protein
MLSQWQIGPNFHAPIGVDIIPGLGAALTISCKVYCDIDQTSSICLAESNYLDYYIYTWNYLHAVGETERIPYEIMNSKNGTTAASNRSPKPPFASLICNTQFSSDHLELDIFVVIIAVAIVVEQIRIRNLGTIALSTEHY